ncbi:MAG: hypothetical protein V4558_04945 [Gemmatimonadota bacterium]
MSSNTIRPRLQLSLGALALLGEELPSLGGRRLFAASCRESGAELRIILHPAPPEGPSPAAMRDRVVRLRQLAHPALALPVGVGDLDGRPWVAELVLRAPTAMQRLGDGGALGVRQGILALRGLTRAIASLHRAGLAHGALDLDAVHLTPTDVQISGFAATTGNNARADLDALGPLAWAFFTGDLPDGAVGKLSDHRRGIPAALDTLVASLLAADPALRPTRAEAVLGVLDAFPTPQPSPISSFLEGAGRGTRTPRAREAVLLLVLVGLSVLVSSLVLSH